MPFTPKTKDGEPSLSFAAAFFHGMRSGATSVFSLVLFGTYIGIGALGHDLNFSVTWTLLSTLLVWAGPAQVILISTLGTGSTLIQAAIAVSLSGIRLLPMVLVLLPMVKTSRMRMSRLLLTAHLTSVSMWVEAIRLLPDVPQGRRLAYCNGIGVYFVFISCVATFLGFELSAKLPPLFGAAVLFLTPMSFLVSITRNSRLLVDRLALGLGLALAPLFTLAGFQFDLLFAGLAAGTVAYGIHRWRQAVQ